jgi:hypothetical protein
MERSNETINKAETAAAVASRKKPRKRKSGGNIDLTLGFNKRLTD